MNMKKTVFWFLIVVMTQLYFAAPADAFLFHATRRAMAKKILDKGFSSASMRASARFGKGVYAATSRKTAMAEVPKAKAILRLQESGHLAGKTLDLRNPTAKSLHKTLGKKIDLRGTIKEGVVGPRLGKDLGKVATRQDKVILYRSARNPRGTNIFIPKKVYGKQPGMVLPDRVSTIH